MDLETQQPNVEAEPVVPNPRSLPPAPEDQLSENVMLTLCCALVLQMAIQSPTRQPSPLLNWLSLVCFSNVWILCASSYLKHDLPNLCRFLRKQVTHALGAIALTMLVLNSPLPLGFKLAVWALPGLSLIIIFVFKYFIHSPQLASSFSSLNPLLFQLVQFLST